VSPLVLLGALLAGALTTLAPCVLPLLPVIVGGSIAPAPSGSGAGTTGGTGSGGVAVEAARRTAAIASRRRAYVITASLGASVFLFTLLLRASTALIGIPPQVWSYVSGAILIALGLAALFPAQWDRVSAALRLQARSTARLQKAGEKDGMLGAVLTGAALGPVFTSCSPLYGYVIVTVLPADLVEGLVLLAAYVVGLCATLLAIALLGQRAVRGLRWAADPHGWFRRSLGLVFILVGVAVAMGWDRDLQAWVLENSPIAPWELDSGFIPEDG
jgi:cytochrome c biogenesis protein CcdA